MACFSFASCLRAYIFITLVLCAIFSAEAVGDEGVDTVSHRICAQIINNGE